MANVLILPVQPIAAIAASRGTGAANLATPDPKEVWKDSASGSAANIDIDLGAVRTVDTVFLGHVLAPLAGTTWAIDGGVSDYGTVIKPSGALRVADAADQVPAMSHALWRGDPVELRYLRIWLGHPSGNPPLSAGVVMAGAAFVPTWNKEWGAGRRVIDMSSVTPLPGGGFAIGRSARKGAYSFSLGDLTDAETDTLYALQLELGESAPVLVVEDPEESVGLRGRIHYSKFVSLRAYERRNPAQTRWDLSVEEWGSTGSPGLAIVPAPEGGASAPTITSSASFTVNEGVQLSKVLVASEACNFAIVGGADAAQAEIASGILRWALNGTKNYEAPTDANEDNAYVIQVQATSIATGLTSAPQTITGNVANVLEIVLPDLVMSATTLTAGTPASGTIANAVAGATVSAIGLPAGLTVNGPARTWAWDGSGSAGTPSFTLRHVHADASNSPHDAVVNLTVNPAASPPTFTSSNTATINEGQQLAKALTASETCTFAIVGGADQGDFEISGTTLRWIGNGTQNYEAPADDDANNAYVVQVQATSTASGLSSAAQTITVTVANVLEVTLTDAVFSATTWQTSVPSSGTISGVHAAAVLSHNTLPSGLTINTGARTWAWDGLGSIASVSFDLTQSHPDGANSPKVTTITGAIQAPPTPISVVAADGWQATMTTPADLAFSPVIVSRQGYSAAGATTTYFETIVTTKRVRQAYPNHALSTADQVALSDYIYSTDTIAGTTNSSAETSPKPIANWSMVDRKVVGNALTLSVVAFHRNGRAGKPVAAVEFRATDGTTTVTSTVSALTVTVDPLTGIRILEYVATLDISGLTDNANVTANAKVYPWIGAAGSVRDSADLASQWLFSPRTFRKNTARAANPPIIRVKAGGNDATAVVSTNPATADASPAATLVGAFNRARDATQLGTAAGALDGLRIQCDAGTWTRTATPTANTVNAAVVVEPIPGVAKAACILQIGATNHGFGLSYLNIRGLTLQRTGAWYINNAASGVTAIEDSAVDFGANTGQLGNATVSQYWINAAFGAASTGDALINSNGAIQAMMRGCTGGAANSVAKIEMICHLGNAMSGGRLDSSATRAQDGVIVAFNKFLSAGNGTSIPVSAGVGSAISGFALVQNVFEYTSTGLQRSFMPSGDSGTASISHLVCWHNSFAGFDTYGRGNLLYDETTGTARSHKLQSFVGNIHVQINTKSDIFKTDGTKLGNWAYDNGVGCRGEFSIYRNAAGNLTSGFHQTYPGLSANIGTINTGVGNDPLYTSNQATTSGPTAGAGGGTYTLQAGSPALALVANSPLGTDLAGNARAGTVAAGAYV